jgi:hypothetical protein
VPDELTVEVPLGLPIQILPRVEVLHHLTPGTDFNHNRRLIEPLFLKPLFAANIAQSFPD